MESVSISWLFLCNRTLTPVDVDLWFKIEEFLHKIAISLNNCPVEQKNYSPLAGWHDLLFSGDHLLRLLSIMSVDLYTSVLSSTVQDTTPRWRSLLMLVLSHSDTHNLSRHIVGCGCHEILILCSIIALFSTTFLLVSISRAEGEGECEFI